MEGHEERDDYREDQLWDECQDLRRQLAAMTQEGDILQQALSQEVIDAAKVKQQRDIFAKALHEIAMYDSLFDPAIMCRFCQMQSNFGPDGHAPGCVYLKAKECLK